jgi:hypothetical protein
MRHLLALAGPSVKGGCWGHPAYLEVWHDPLPHVVEIVLGGGHLLVGLMVLWLARILTLASGFLPCVREVEVIDQTLEECGTATEGGQ